MIENNVLSVNDMILFSEFQRSINNKPMCLPMSARKYPLLIIIAIYTMKYILHCLYKNAVLITFYIIILKCR